MADNYGLEVDKVKAAVSSSELEKDIAANKAIDFVKANAVITEAEPKESKPAAKKAPAKKAAAKKTEEKSDK